jgi:hypothetical protein
MAAKPTPKPGSLAKRSTPVPMPVKPSKTTGTMPSKPGNIATGSKKTSAPKPKPKGLNDFLKEGKTPPSKNKKGIPSDADVIIKGYNDKKKQPISKKVTEKILKDSKKKAKDSIAKKKADEMFPKYMRSK